MTQEKPDQDKDVTKEGAVEIEEEKLDKASGGSLSKIEIDDVRKAGGKQEIY